MRINVGKTCQKCGLENHFQDSFILEYQLPRRRRRVGSSRVTGQQPNSEMSEMWARIPAAKKKATANAISSSASLWHMVTDKRELQNKLQAKHLINTIITNRKQYRRKLGHMWFDKVRERFKPTTPRKMKSKLNIKIEIDEESCEVLTEGENQNHTMKNHSEVI